MLPNAAFRNLDCVTLVLWVAAAFVGDSSSKYLVIKSPMFLQCLWVSVSAPYSIRHFW